jgi:hypothetical protein
MSYLAFSTNHRIIMKHIVLTLTIALLTGISSLSLHAGTLAVSGTLSKETTSTTNTAPIEVKDCNGNVLSTIASTAVTTTKYEPYTKSGQTLRFEVTRLENPVVSIITIDTNINNINYNATDGAFSVDLVRNVIIESRYSYKVKIRISENAYASVLFEREYSIAPAGSGSAFPIGSVIAYLGNGGNIAGMEANGWFKCDGRAISGLSALSADEKTALTNILGGSSNLPDLRGNFLRGLDEGIGRDDDRTTRTGGESTTGVRSQQVENYRSHNHGGTTGGVGNHNHGGSTGETTISTVSGRTGVDGNSRHAANDNYSSGSHTHSIAPDGAHSHSISSDGGNETRPDNVAVYWLIRGR